MKNVLFSALLGMLTTLSPVSAHFSVAAQSIHVADDKELQQYAGTYTFADNGTFTKLTVSVDKGELYAQVDSNERYKLIKQTDADTYKSTSSYGSLFTFTRDPNTKAVTGFKMKIMDYDLAGTKDKA